ncbi:HAMP domain-containing sensor histidine kinase [Bacteroides sp. ET225]|uniref:sensor histidine kinase n=1 Tax=Bacteroides sp. ET225 TaxID=2972461 RepID=UPI0021ACF41A|nr:HAMP domain-containing sensor histidine kinase [Bacteroides sp. ET225]MCR8918200.1 HAMP domain-containing histidine kinase [Bacteroides sp. ET225]
MKKWSLSRKMLTQFVVCMAVLLLLATPLFYFLTKHYYAEDMIDIVEAVGQGKPIPPLDLEQDIMQGVMIQFGVIVFVLAVSTVLTVRFISRRLWKPFDETLRRIESFRLEDGVLPVLADSDVAEFIRLNHALQTLMQNSLASYRTQKEFTENASHELQTPLAVFQSKLDLLLQQPGLTRQQAELMQGLYETSNRLARLNRNLLLLAKIDNHQYGQMEEINLGDFLDELLPSLEILSGSIVLHKDFRNMLTVCANRTLLESLVNNLVVNAVRHNRPNGEITLAVAGRQLILSNTSDEPALDSRQIFNRFYRPSEKTKGSGLGLAIVKAVCEYHGWMVGYQYKEGKHCFTVSF